MKITRVVIDESVKGHGTFLASCSIVLDDCLRLNDIRLFKNKVKGYYLILPSKQDIYKEVETINDGLNLALPCKEPKECTSEKKIYDEFFHPIDSSFYKDILETIKEGYKKYEKTGCTKYKP